MKIWFRISVCLVIVGCFIVLLVLRTFKETEVQPEAAKKDVKKEVEFKKDGYRQDETITRVDKRLQLPIELHDFYLKNPGQQLDDITNLQVNPDLSNAVVIFLNSAIRDKTLDEVTRNNMANALLGQRSPDPHLYLIFLKMIDDLGESYQWREYCVQHLARTAETSSDPKRVVEKLKTLMKDGEMGIPGTALLHLHRLEENGTIHLDASYTDNVIKLLNSPNADILVRISAIGVLAERGAKEALPTVRILARDKTPTLRRVALAALGLIGEQTDESILQAATENGGNDGTRDAAQGALKLMKGRVPLSSEPAVQTPEKF